MTFITNTGYTTINNNWETLTDKELTKHDIMTALNITKGECDWNPSFGTTIKEKLFRAKTNQLKNEIIDELKAIFAEDPRVELKDIETNDIDKGWIFYCSISYLNGTPEIWEYEYQTQDTTNQLSNGYYPLGSE